MGYGTSMGLTYGVVQGSIHSPAPLHCLVFGLGTWAHSVAQMVPTDLYRPPWKYPLTDLAIEVG